MAVAVVLAVDSFNLLFNIVTSGCYDHNYCKFISGGRTKDRAITLRFYLAGLDYPMSKMVDAVNGSLSSVKNG